MSVQLPEKCITCMIRSIFCNISDKLKEDQRKWSSFAIECGKRDEMARILYVEHGGINKINRSQILDDTLGAFYSSSLLYFPFEALKRVLTDKFVDVFPEYKEETDREYVKWTLGIEAISKFCQLSEILAAHLLASEKVSFNYTNYSGYAEKLVKYKTPEAMDFFNKVPSMNPEDFIAIMGYPELEKQNELGKKWVYHSLVELQIDLENIGVEYKKFIELYNAYKHGCRILHPKNIQLHGSSAAGLIVYLTKRAVIEKGGSLSILEFPAPDFKSFFLNFENLFRVINVMLSNRRERYYYLNNVSDDVKISLYFNPMLTEPSEIPELDLQL